MFPLFVSSMPNTFTSPVAGTIQPEWLRSHVKTAVGPASPRIGQSVSLDTRRVRLIFTEGWVTPLNLQIITEYNHLLYVHTFAQYLFLSYLYRLFFLYSRKHSTCVLNVLHGLVDFTVPSFYCVFFTFCYLADKTYLKKRKKFFLAAHCHLSY